MQRAPVLAQVVAFDLAGYQQHRRRSCVGRSQSGGGVEGARPWDHQPDTGLTGGAGISVGHISDALFMAGQHQADAGLVIEGVERVHYLDPGKGENHLHAVAGQGAYQGLSAAHLRHGTPLQI